MTLQDLEAFTSVDIPQPDCLLVIAAGKNFTVWTKGYGPYFSAMPLQRIQAFTAVDGPQPQRLVVTTANKYFTSRMESH